MTSSLARFVEDVRILLPGQEHHVDRLPDGRTSLYFRIMDGQQHGDLTVAGPRTRAVYKISTGVSQVVALQFKPGWAAPILGVAASALTDRIVYLQDIWGDAGAQLCWDLLAANTPDAAIQRLSQALTARTERNFESMSGHLARRAVRLLEAGEVRIETVAHQLGVTPRHLRRAFTDSIGVAPKEFARAVRLQRALRLAAHGNDWGRIATDAGYYDQAHLIGEFRDLLGFTPSAFVKRTAALIPQPPSANKETHV